MKFLVCSLWLTLGCARAHSAPSTTDPETGSSVDAGAHDAVVALSSADASAHDAGVEPSDGAWGDGAARPARRLPHNVIVFMGDGMGPEQLSTGRYAKDGGLRIDTLMGPAYANTDSLTTLAAADPELAPTDSAAGATVIATGVRVDNGALSLTSSGTPLETVLEVCKKAGKATGLVTTSYFFDASPAAFASHQPSRGLSDAIIHQMLTRTRPDVIMGSGAVVFDIPEFGLHQDALDAGYVVLRGLDALLAWDPVAQPRMLGLFATDFIPATVASEPYSMTPALERRVDSPDPTLALMTQRALERLASDPDGFFLFAEDEQLDQMGHRGPAEVAWVNRAYPMQVAALDDAVGVALDWVRTHSSFEETLIVVLADHETGGYHYDHRLGPVSGDFSAYVEDVSFRIGIHTRRPTAVYALGPGSSALSQIHEHADTHRLLIGAIP